MARGTVRELYARVLGGAWHELADPVRRLHTPAGINRGRFRVTSAGRLARWIAKLSGLPRPAGNAEVVLQVVENGDEERWERSFDGRAFVTSQRTRVAGFVDERFGAWELRFRPAVESGGLHYRQQSARLCLGRVRVRLPFGPRVAAVEKPGGANRINVSVTVRLPLIGRILAYDGWLDLEEAPA